MFFQIKEIVLWPRGADKPPRRVKFQLGKVNVISGASRTGKSAVIPIIDYCLGSGSCSIPVNTIRKNCEWFGVVIATSQGEKLLARREPGAQRSTEDMFIMEATSIAELPLSVTKNTSADAIRRLLDELAGLTNLDFSGGDESATGFGGRPSFRDLAAFTFQPQNVVANPDVLFFKTNTYEHREKLRKIFPYVLGAVTPSLMAMQFELRRTQQELRRKERELKQAREVSAQWLADLKAKFSEAQELGLTTRTDVEPSRDQMIELLSEIVSRTDLTLAVTTNTITDAMQELGSLEGEERTVSRELTVLRHRLEEMNRMRRGADAYQGALIVQRDRLQLSKWISSHAGHGSDCPVCGSHTESSQRKLTHLAERLKEVEVEVGVDTEVPAAFERELQRVTTEVDVTSERLKSVQIRRRALSSRSDEARSRQYSAKKAERFVGNLEAALDLHRRLGSDAELVEEVSRLTELELDLRAKLRGQDIDARKRRALQNVNTNAARLLPLLDAERPEDPVSLEVDDLTVKVIGLDRADYLSEIGSGSNWLSYHLAVLLGLHQFFLSQTKSPIPAFLVLDQPSQVYFPTKVVDRDGDQVDDDPQLTRDEDVEAVRKAFQVLGQVVNAAQGKLQVLVLDHASKEVWGDVEGVVGVEDWRGGTKLVPMEWMQ
ncbi:MAG: DUF3732 domain-containing protein [Rhodoferax sp.]|uniref:DUF3732 domain-containing protein n=1 Tax=Rhodoferax sp. TaxID=50421 RepID=UPI0026275E58|nr:DUF3732 domain-containing protein [Rhodoferax sp.]MDD5333914.1 DUF3732 domain-containing protein [Rhodoferax sp.]